MSTHGAVLGGRLADMLRAGELDLPPLGNGQTPERWAALTAIARRDLSEGRLAEAHADAVQILREHGVHPDPDCTYGVWASDHPRRRVTAADGVDDSLILRGVKAFCSGAGLVSRALVTVHPVTADGTDRAGSRRGRPILVDLDLATLAEHRIDRSAWTTTAMADTSTAEVDLTGLTVAKDQVLGEPGWYLDRAGFWDGAVGPAACWVGGAVGLVDLAGAAAPSDPHALAHLGAMAATVWGLQAALESAGRAIDAEAHCEQGRCGAVFAADDRHASAPSGFERGATPRARALAVRHLADVGCADIQERCRRTLGPRSLVSDAAVYERDHALSLYRRQCHAERDLEVLGRCVLEQNER